MKHTGKNGGPGVDVIVKLTGQNDDVDVMASLR